MNIKYLAVFILSLFISTTVLAQRPPRPEGPPGGGPPRDGIRPPMGEGRDDRHNGKPKGDWLKALDTNGNGILESDELQSAMDRTFAEFDKNNNGSIDAGEGGRPSRPANHDEQGFREHQGEMDSKKLLPPFFFMDRLKGDQAVSRAEFEKIVRGVFNEMDKNNDGTLGRSEADRMPDRDGPHHPDRPGMAPNAKFIAAELRFGDKLVKGQPFSAETVIEDTRRLFDGSTVTKKNSGAIYRDGDGRTRREQPLEMVGGINIVGSDSKPQMLVFINDFANKSQIFLDFNNKVARKSRFGDIQPPEPGEPGTAKMESLGTKVIERVIAEGTRTTFEIPAGEIGNDKPIQVVTEKWFSPELQVIVMSRHTDPVAGEHVFRLVNIKRAEPAADLFAIPAGFRTETRPDRRPEE